MVRRKPREGERCIVDTHAHLCDALFDADRADVLERAQAVGVTAVVAVGEDLADARLNLDLAARHPLIRPAAGLYPTRLDLEQAEAMVSFIRREREDLVAIGEVGLDYWVVQDDSERALQREIFSRFIDLSVVRSPQKQNLVKRLPLSSLLIETDSPVLGPDPDERNEPANITLAVAAIAQLKKVSKEEVLAAVAENALRLFGDLSRR
jgi:TatD DNase family protein